MIDASQHPPERGMPTADEMAAFKADLPTFTGSTVQPAPSPIPDESVDPFGRRRIPRRPSTDRRRTPRTPRAQLFVSICHWGMVILMALNLLSGMRIGWGYRESLLGGMTGTWGAILMAVAPKGTMFGINLNTLHVVLPFLMLLVTGVYVGYLFMSHTTRRLQVTRQDLQKLVAGLRSGSFWHNKAALWSANVLVYWLSFLFIFVLMVTGIALYRLDSGLSTMLGGYNLMRLLHGLIAYLLIPYVVLHVVLQWCFGRFWTIFKAQLYSPHIRAGLICLAVSVPVIIGVYMVNAIPKTLTVKRIVGNLPAPVLDGDPSDAVWSQAETVTVRTVKGTNTQDHVDIAIKALYDGTYIYFQYQWDAADVSYKRYPLLKTEQGWKVLHTSFEETDETVFYEDKLSMYFTTVTNGGCAETCHIGVGPSSAKSESMVCTTRGTARRGMSGIGNPSAPIIWGT